MKRFHKILYLCEAEGDQQAALARAVTLAEGNQATLTVLDAVPAISDSVLMPVGLPPDASLQDALVADRRERIETLVQPFRARMAIEVDVCVGALHLQATRAVLRDGFDLIMKPAENPAWTQRLFGGDDMHLLRQCPVPVWLMKPGEKARYSRIMAAVDFDPEQSASIRSPLNRQILELAASLAIGDVAELQLAHVWDAPAEMLVRRWSSQREADTARYVDAERARHQQALGELHGWLGKLIGAEAIELLAPRRHLSRGAARTLLPELAQALEVDLVVMGTVGRTGIAGLFIGNTAETVLEQLRCSVLAVKPPGFVSPVRAED